MSRSTVTAYRYKVYDPTIDDYRHSTRMATPTAIEIFGGVMLPKTRFEVYSDLISEGWTEKNFAATSARPSPTKGLRWR
jgi:hypothetical protein